MSEIPTSEQFLGVLQPAEQIANAGFRLAVVAALFSNGTAKVTFDGETEASEKEYPYLASYVPKTGDRVLLAAVAASYVILGKVNYSVSPGSAAGAGEFTTLSTSGKATLASLEVTGAAQFKGSVTFASGTDLSIDELATSGQITAASLRVNGNVGFFGTSPTYKRTVYYANSDTASVIRQRLNDLIYALAQYGLITPSN